MGHIDHGKSTLLDTIRHANIVAGEAGQITQHLGAYEITHKTKDGLEKKITFIDTPGHEAFKSVRSRGAEVADVAVLIVSAEDGVMPQTIEAYKIIKANKIPTVVAINKIDSDKADIQRTKNNLVENEIYIEGYGGDIPVAEISAKTGKNLDTLLDLILLSAELQEYKGDPTADAEGFVIESNKDKQVGVTTTIVIKNGTLRKGQFISSFDACTPVRSITNHLGETLDEATFSTPVRISGWNKSPKVGFEFSTFSCKKEAENYCNDFKNLETGDRLKKNAKCEIKNLSGKIKKAENFLVPIIIKADTDGSLEAILYELKKIETSNEENNAQTKIIAMGTGNITENDLKLASGDENAIIVGFGVGIDKQAGIMAERFAIKMKTFKVIYDLTDWLKNTIEENRPRMEIEERRGLVKILRIFNKVKNNQIIGARVTEGKIAIGNKFKLLRRSEEIGSGVVKGLQEQKNQVAEVAEGSEFGASVDIKTEIVTGDEIEIFEIVKK